MISDERSLDDARCAIELLKNLHGIAKQNLEEKNDSHGTNSGNARRRRRNY